MLSRTGIVDAAPCCERFLTGADDAGMSSFFRRYARGEFTKSDVPTLGAEVNSPTPETERGTNVSAVRYMSEVKRATVDYVDFSVQMKSRLYIIEKLWNTSAEVDEWMTNFFNNTCDATPLDQHHHPLFDAEEKEAEFDQQDDQENDDGDKEDVTGTVPTITTSDVTTSSSTDNAT